MYRIVTVPHAINPNAMLTKKQSCGGMNSILWYPLVPEHGAVWYYAVPAVKNDDEKPGIENALAPLRSVAPLLVCLCWRYPVIGEAQAMTDVRQPKPLRHEQFDTLPVKLAGGVPQQMLDLSVGEQNGSRFADDDRRIRCAVDASRELHGHYGQGSSTIGRDPLRNAASIRFLIF